MSLKEREKNNTNSLLALLIKKIKTNVNRPFDASSIILKTEVANAYVKVVIYESSFKWIVFKYAWIMEMYQSSEKSFARMESNSTLSDGFYE